MFVVYIRYMGTKDRKEREKEELKGLILKAAKEIFFEKGYAQTSIRNIADRIEYSPGTIYLHFKDKDSIFHALQQEGFMLLRQQFGVLQVVADPFERLKAMGKLYLNFAMENPEYYDLMFVIRAPMNVLEAEACWDEGQTAFNVLVQVVQACIEQGHFKGYDTEEMAYVIWSTVHGMATISIRGRCRVISDEKRETIETLGYDTFVQMLNCM
ncbi:TetR family transcriptional regulator [Flammeovirgaceae bacterium 311]|nr:TetR family transcriptional regulator [Flammeovirgaceae bacterium 311]